MTTPDTATRSLKTAARSYLRNVAAFAERGAGVTLRPYQRAPIPNILKSIDEGLGLSFVIVFPRQSGKDELITHLIGYLLTICSVRETFMVEVNPTYKPQTINAIMRLETRLNMNPITYRRWNKRSDFIRRIGLSQISYLSGDGQANVVGATASLLLVVNEAQDIPPAIYDKNFAPMCASTNATKIFCGTVWTSTTLLAREIRHARREQERDGFQRLFMYNADDVARIHKPYRAHVAGQVKTLGRQHPMIRTQYFNEEIDAQAGLFHEGRLALMTADQPEQAQPITGHVYAFTIDVAGQDESIQDMEGMGNPGRDSTTLSIVDIDLSTLATLQAPTYRIVHRRAWTGLNHLTVFGQIKALADAWQPQKIVIDATGVGEGLWAMLDKAYPTRVLPVKFSQQTKSEIGWGYLAIIETGRLRDCARTDTVRAQYAACLSEILSGPAKTLRWGVPDGTRSQDGTLIHDDYIMADALTAILDTLTWTAPLRATVENFGTNNPEERLF